MKQQYLRGSVVFTHHRLAFESQHPLISSLLIMCFTLNWRSRQDVDNSRTCVKTQQNSGSRGGGPGYLGGGGGGGGGDAYGPNIKTGKNQNHGLQHPAESGDKKDSRSSGDVGGGRGCGVGYESADMISTGRNQNHHGAPRPADGGDQKKTCPSPGGITGGGKGSGSGVKAEGNQDHREKKDSVSPKSISSSVGVDQAVPSLLGPGLSHLQSKRNINIVNE